MRVYLEGELGEPWARETGKEEASKEYVEEQSPL